MGALKILGSKSSFSFSRSFIFLHYLLIASQKKGCRQSVKVLEILHAGYNLPDIILCFYSSYIHIVYRYKINSLSQIIYYLLRDGIIWFTKLIWTNPSPKIFRSSVQHHYLSFFFNCGQVTIS